MRYATDKACAGCNTGEPLSYPPIKIPTGKMDTSRYPAIHVEYRNYCYKCALAILMPNIPVGISIKFAQDVYAVRRNTLGLPKFSEEDLEMIYDELPRPE